MILDYSTSRPDPAAMARAGVTAVMRYLSLTPAKNLSAAERDRLHASGLGIGLVWETTANRAGQGYAAGQSDARNAEAQADALGYPASCPIFYAVDFDAAPAAVAPYFQGVQSVARRPIGVYGSATIVEAIPAPWKWQTVAWSRGRISAAAHLYQTVEAPPFSGTDVNHTRIPFPLWTSSGVTTVSNVTASSSTVPTNIPGALTATTPQEDFLMALTDDEQRRLLAAADGWNTWAPSLKENTDRLPHIHQQVDIIAAGVGNVTNGVVALLGRAPGAAADIGPLLDAIKALPAETVAAIKAAL